MYKVSIKALHDEVNAIVGVPFEYGGRDPKKSLDCLGVLIHLTKKFSIPFEEELTKEVYKGFYTEDSRFDIAKKTLEGAKSNLHVRLLKDKETPRAMDFMGFVYEDTTHAVLVLPHNMFIHASEGYTCVTTHPLTLISSLRSFTLRSDAIELCP